MKEHPILFGAPMVRALLTDTKTQTRRVVKPQPSPGLALGGARVVEGMTVWGARCPYGQPGDRLWVRETFARIDGQTRPWIETDYAATYTHGDRLGDALGIKKRWTPSIHMPRHASRIDLEVTGVRVERLQDISASDAIAEGISLHTDHHHRPATSVYGPVQTYRDLWEDINGDGAWDLNPWVWVVGFKRIKAPVWESAQ